MFSFRRSEPLRPPDEFQEKLEKLGEHAEDFMQRRHLANEEKKRLTLEERAEKWETVKRDYPDHAKLLMELSSVFGRPKEVSIIDQKTKEVIL